MQILDYGAGSQVCAEPLSRWTAHEVQMIEMGTCALPDTCMTWLGREEANLCSRYDEQWRVYGKMTSICIWKDLAASAILGTIAQLCRDLAVG